MLCVRRCTIVCVGIVSHLGVRMASITVIVRNRNKLTLLTFLLLMYLNQLMSQPQITIASMHTSLIPLKHVARMIQVAVVDIVVLVTAEFSAILTKTHQRL